ncbi:hypothetical protein BDV33DRAFT_185424 [Aspergillus novoparasiticus]|uniref:Uncharacterized protein n=1 Tax=Aspergillus novoparasiticus TaxID=986946 RepID=A0A5N6E9M6_9EURO|nr:hypothetical protein BDV33DRAFT_185424 [Aspergillus novoparasiticus]
MKNTADQSPKGDKEARIKQWLELTGLSELDSQKLSSAQSQEFAILLYNLCTLNQVVIDAAPQMAHMLRQLDFSPDVADWIESGPRGELIPQDKIPMPLHAIPNNQRTPLSTAQMQMLNRFLDLFVVDRVSSGNVPCAGVAGVAGAEIQEAQE